MPKRPSTRRSEPRGRALVHETRGAIYVEFLIAFLPVFIFFLCLIQLSLLFSAKLMVEHSAVVGARAAAVVFGDEPGPYGEEAAKTNTLSKKRRETVRKAVLLTLAPLILDGSAIKIDVKYPKGGEPGGEDQKEDDPLPAMTLEGTTMVRVRVETSVLCKIALASTIICEPASGWLGKGAALLGFAPPRAADVNAESVFPYQGASYTYEKDENK